MVTLMVHEDAQHLGIVHPVACIINSVDVRDDSSALDAEIEILMQQLHQVPAPILSRPEVLGFQKLFTRMGYPDQVPAGQRLIESFQRHAFKHYNNIIDSYNIASASFGSGLGMHDARMITAGDSPLHVYRARGDERIIPLFKTKPVTVTKGDLVYGLASCQMDLFAWLGKRDVDADQFKVINDTVSLLLVVLGNAATSEEYNRAVCFKVLELIRRTCPVATTDLLDVVFA